MKSRIATFLIAMSMFITGTAFASTPVTQHNDVSKAVSSLSNKNSNTLNLLRIISLNVVYMLD